MKNVLITAICILINPLYGMENPDKKIIATIEAAARKKRSITLAPHKQFPLSLEPKSSINNNIRINHGIPTNPDKPTTVSPYGPPFDLDEQKDTNVTMPLSISAGNRRFYINLHIGPNSIVEFGDTIFFDYNEEDDKICIIQNNNKKPLGEIHLESRPLEVGLIKKTKK